MNRKNKDKKQIVVDRHSNFSNAIVGDLSLVKNSVDD